MGWRGQFCVRMAFGLGGQMDVEDWDCHKGHVRYEDRVSGGFIMMGKGRGTGNFSGGRGVCVSWESLESNRPYEKQA